MNYNDAQNRLDKGKCEILREYNYAVDRYNEVYNFNKCAELDEECINKLVGVGESLYEVYEKTMKYVLFKYYFDEVLNGRMTFQDFERDIARPLDTGGNSALIGGKINIKTLSVWMAQYANPQLEVWDNGTRIQSRLLPPPSCISSNEIDTRILQNNAGIAHNDNKHKFYYAADAQLMTICSIIFPHIENLISKYIADPDCKVKSYGIIINSKINEIDRQFNGWNVHSIYKYVLIIDRTELTQESKKILALLPWAIIIDFDSNSNKNGLLQEYILQKKKTPILLTPLAMNKFDFSVLDTCWIFPNGREEEPMYKVQNENQWRRIARKNLQKLLEQYHSHVNAPLKILVLDKENAKRVGETKISWYGIQHQFPVEWTEYYSILHNGEESLGTVKSPLKIILHEPGAGGTTFLRMYAYERSKKQPTIFLKQYSLTQMANEIEDFYLSCKKTPICICADSFDITYEQCQELKDAIDALSLAHDFVYAHRIGISDKSFCTIAELKGDTLKEMKRQLFDIMDKMPDNVIKRSIEKRKQDINHIIASSDKKSDRMPLIMSMYAFDDKYEGTKEYIHNFILCLSEMQQRQLLYAAIIDIYAEESLEINFFSEKREEMDKYGEQKYSLFNGKDGKMVTEKLFIFEEKEHGVFTKIKHPQFSKAIIDELLNCQNNKATFYQKLVSNLCEMICFCASAYVNRKIGQPLIEN